MKHVVTLTVNLHLVIADDDARLCWQWPVDVWQQWNLPERVYLKALNGWRGLTGWLPGREDWRGAWRVMFVGGEYWQLVMG